MERDRLHRVLGAGVVVALLAVLAYGIATDGLPFGTKQQKVAALDPSQVIILRTPGGLLEVATLNRVEEFGWQTKYTCPVFDCEKLLGATITRVRAPVHYVYRVPLAETWELRPEGDGYLLVVPPVVPSLPVAVETAKLQIETQSGWSSPSRELNVQSTLRQLGPELERRATLPQYLALQQPHAAKTVEEFAQKWMREQGKPVTKKIRVVFRSGGG
jgi:hypothetical protein